MACSRIAFILILMCEFAHASDRLFSINHEAATVHRRRHLLRLIYPWTSPDYRELVEGYDPQVCDIMFKGPVTADIGQDNCNHVPAVCPSWLGKEDPQIFIRPRENQSEIVLVPIKAIMDGVDDQDGKPCASNGTEVDQKCYVAYHFSLDAPPPGVTLNDGDDYGIGYNIIKQCGENSTDLGDIIKYGKLVPEAPVANNTSPPAAPTTEFGDGAIVCREDPACLIEFPYKEEIFPGHFDVNFCSPDIIGIDNAAPEITIMLNNGTEIMRELKWFDALAPVKDGFLFKYNIQAFGDPLPQELIKEIKTFAMNYKVIYKCQNGTEVPISHYNEEVPVAVVMDQLGGTESPGVSPVTSPGQGPVGSVCHIDLPSSCWLQFPPREISVQDFDPSVCSIKIMHSNGGLVPEVAIKLDNQTEVKRELMLQEIGETDQGAGAYKIIVVPFIEQQPPLPVNSWGRIMEYGMDYNIIKSCGGNETDVEVVKETLPASQVADAAGNFPSTSPIASPTPTPSVVPPKSPTPIPSPAPRSGAPSSSKMGTSAIVATGIMGAILLF